MLNGKSVYINKDEASKIYYSEINDARSNGIAEYDHLTDNDKVKLAGLLIASLDNSPASYEAITECEEHGPNNILFANMLINFPTKNANKYSKSFFEALLMNALEYTSKIIDEDLKR